MKHGFIVGHAFHARRELVTEVTGMLGLSEADGDNAQPGRFDFVFVQLQLSQPIATMNSTEVAQEGQEDRAVGPILPERYFLPIDVESHTFWRMIARLQLFLFRH